jgi:type III restriction enzyme
MPDVVIENPFLNSPYRVPTRHVRFGEDGITDEVVQARRPSSYVVPIKLPKAKGRQLALENQWAQDRIQETRFGNQIRERVDIWRRGGYRDTLVGQAA